MRKKPNLGPRMERCAEVLIDDPAALRGRWLEEFPGHGGLLLELGCGKGRFTVGTAESNPDMLLVAVERVADAMVVEQNDALMTLCDHLSREDSEEDYNEALHQTIAVLMTAKETAPLEILVREQLSHRYRLVLDAICATDFNDLDAIEHLRSLCKTSRYLFEFFSPLADYQLAQQYLRIRRLNQRLSIYCDTFYNLDQLQELLGENDDPATTRALRLYTEMMHQTRQTQSDHIQKLIDEMGCSDDTDSDTPKKKKHHHAKKLTTQKNSTPAKKINTKKAKKKTK